MTQPQLSPRTRRLSRAIGIVGGVILPLALLAGCTSSGDNTTADGEVASLETPGAAATPSTGPQKTGVEKLVDCLRDAGIEAQVAPRDEVDDFALVTEEPYQLCTVGNGCRLSYGGPEGTEVSEADQVASEERWAAAWEKRGGRPDSGEPARAFLMIGDTDHTDVFAGCVASSGYTDPHQKALPPEEEVKLKQAVFDATMPWVTCARDNGFPEIKDPVTPVADGNETWPRALIPASTSEDQLRALLRKCPVFDTAAHTREDAARAREGDDYDGAIIDPEVWIDAPGFDGSSSEADSLDKATQARLQRLQDLLGSAAKSYSESGGGVG